jgi:hypothetical protein
MEDVTGASEDSSMHFRVLDDGALTELISLNGNGTNTVVFNSDVTMSEGIVVSGDVQASGFLYGDGSQLIGVQTATTTNITYPSIVWNTDHFDATTAVGEYGGNVYRSDDSGALNKHCVFIGQDVGYTDAVGAPSSAYKPEPRNVSALNGFDGTEDIDMIVVHNGSGDFKTTYLVAATNTTNVSNFLIGSGYIIDATISSVYTANGATSNYTFNLSAITAAGATLWGGDGAGGERSTISSGDQTAGTITLDPQTARPTCDATVRGMLYFTRNDVGSDADTLELRSDERRVGEEWTIGG